MVRKFENFVYQMNIWEGVKKKESGKQTIKDSEWERTNWGLMDEGGWRMGQILDGYQEGHL